MSYAERLKQLTDLQEARSNSPGTAYEVTDKTDKCPQSPPFVGSVSYSQRSFGGKTPAQATGPQPLPNGTNGTNGTLPAAIRLGLELLAKAPAPRVRCPELWPGVVDDALRLASEGWVGKALKLGWSELDLFGAVTDPEGPPDTDGLAVKLNGRRVLALCESFATVADANGGRSYLYRGDTKGARLLWAIGQ